MRYSPKSAPRSRVDRALQRGRYARLTASVSVTLSAVEGEPKVICQPWESCPMGEGELWLWSDGSLRRAPELVVEGSPFQHLVWEV